MVIEIWNFSKVLRAQWSIPILEVNIEPRKGFRGYTIYSGHCLQWEKKDIFALKLEIQGKFNAGF